MKKFWSSIVLILVVCVFIFTGCSTTGLKNNPDVNATVIGNGGVSVIKGDYLYYINGYVDSSSLTNQKTQNVFGKVSKGAIYRTKLNNGKVNKDKDGFLVSTEVVVSKVVGFQFGGFFVFGDNIYYTTPHMNQDKGGTVQNSYVEFHKVCIDGTKDTLLFYIGESVTALDWAIYRINNVDYVVAFSNNNTIFIHNASTNKSIKTIANVTSTALIKDVEFDMINFKSDDILRNNLYYTRDYEENENSGNVYTGNVVSFVEITSGNITTAKVDTEYKYNIVDLKNNSLYYSKAKTNSNTLFYRNKLEKSFNNSIELKLSDLPFSKIKVLENTTFQDINRFVGIYGESDATKKVYLINNGVAKIFVDSAVEIVGLYSDKLIYTSEKMIMSVNVLDALNGTVTPKKLSNSDKEFSDNIKNSIDFDGKYLFYLTGYIGEGSTSINSYYLNYVDTFDPSSKPRFLGEFNGTDKPIKPEQNKYEEGTAEELKVYVPHID